MQNFEKLGAFYLGKMFDLEQRKLRNDLLLYDAKDLTTHAVCVGMTGSGKTGLCLSLLEEAAIDGIPAIAIDPKGDLGNLFLAFPDLAPADFRPWVDEAEAARKGMTADQFATQTAKTWKEGLAEWGQDGDRIRRYRDAVDMAIYTPGSNAGKPLTVLRSFAAPPAELQNDSDAYRERISAATSGLLALLGIAADPVRSREHILISNLLDHAWRAGRDLDVAGLIREIQSPPIERVGVFDLESFFPASDRMELAMTLNNLLASPSFASWMQGEQIDIKKLLYTESGKPRLSVLSIAHLSESERMFFVTILLNEIVAWMRSQPGTSSLRAILYMDEVFGFFPPTANPPSKRPMLTLLKQARAYGLGVVLATQNPVDLDYKGLSNAGTWFLGRLQTERDKQRVLEGLEGASAQAGSTFDRQQMEATLAGLGNRVFLMNNVHDDEPVVFQTRWAMSYLRGPLTRTQIQKLSGEQGNETAEVTPINPAQPVAATPQSAKLPAAEAAAVKSATQSQRPTPPPQVEESFLRTNGVLPGGCRLVYRPALLGQGRLHFVRSTYKVDTWRNYALMTVVHGDVDDDVWNDSHKLDAERLPTQSRPDPDATFSPLPAALETAKCYKSAATDLKDHFYRNETAVVRKCAKLKAYSDPGETEGDFRARLAHTAREQRDLAVEKLRAKYEKKLASMQKKLQTAEQRVDREKSQFQKATFDSALSFGSTIIGALFGRKLASVTNVGKATTSMRSAGRAAQQKGDITRAEEKVKALNDELEELEEEFKEDTEELEAAYEPAALELEQHEVRPRKSDIQVEDVGLVWTPWFVDGAGVAEAGFGE